jgi:UDP-N-acetylglucosamine 4-epimerase
MFEKTVKYLQVNQYTWIITGVAGFIGSNILEWLLKHNQKVIGIDNFSTGTKENLEEVKKIVGDVIWDNFIFHNFDICNYEDIKDKFCGVDFVLHQAALGSVPRSIENPMRTDLVNTNGFVNVLHASKEANVSKFIFAASSSTYGDHPDLPKVEEKIGNPLSPYAVSKYCNELYASVFKKVYGIEYVGLRYFNVFGKRQNPEGPYAAVIPRWIKDMIASKDVYINGDGSTSRDFCYIQNVIQANILAAFSNNQMDAIFNVAFSQRTTLNNLFDMLKNQLIKHNISYDKKPIYRDFRPGDVKHSLASIEKAQQILGYSPMYSVETGLSESIDWFVDRFK